MQNWSLSEPVARIGGADADTGQILHQVMSVHEDRSGRLFILQFGSPFIAVFDANGRRQATLGGAGGGPGDFSMPNAIQTWSDSIWIGDARAGKFARFDDAFELVGAATFRSAVPGLASRSPQLDALGVAAGGQLLTSVRAGDSIQWHLGDSEKPLVTVSSASRSGLVRVGNVALSFIQPFRDDPLIGSDPDRTMVVVLHRSTNALHYRLLAINGARDTTFPITSIPEPIDSEQINAQVERFIASFQGRGVPINEVRAAVSAALHVPDVNHGVAGFTISRDSLLAITFVRGSPTSNRVRVFDVTTGTEIGAFSLPDEARVMRMSRDYVWLLERGPYDEEALTKRVIKVN